MDEGEDDEDENRQDCGEGEDEGDKSSNVDDDENFEPIHTRVWRSRRCGWRRLEERRPSSERLRPWR